MEKRELEALLKEMSLEEKVGQLLQVLGYYYIEEAKKIVTGPEFGLKLSDEMIEQAGSAMSVRGAKVVKKIQKEYMEKHPHHIPLLFMMDVIHGMKTIFPAPLAQAATFDPELTREGSEIAAREAAATGLQVAFSPMADLVRDPRWGRVVESFGEDPYLSACFVKAQVEGLQGFDMKEEGRVCACIKHFAGYGGAEAGRDYNTVNLDTHTFKEFYLKGYQAGIDAGAGMVMTSFNTIDGIPATANHHLMRDILRGEMGFDGVLISDYAAIKETIAHGYSENEEKAAENSLRAGVDIDMMTATYANHVAGLVQKGVLEETLLDESVMRILELKNKLGLFENPYKDADAEKEKELLLCPAHRAAARKAASRSFVLLKNEEVLPVDTRQKIAFIGPYTDRKQMLSSWAITGDANDSVTIKEAAEEVFDADRTVYLPGCPVLTPGFGAAQLRLKTEEELPEETIREMKEEALKAAKDADLVIMPLGEHYMESGEATSKANIEIPEIQLELLEEVVRVNPNVVVVLFNGRPLDLRKVSRLAKAILEVWLPGTEGGHAIVDVLTGKVNPSGKLPMSFPYSVGQVPVYYNAYSTGRGDFEGCTDHFRSRYLDIPNEPLYSFGYGLSYTKFELSAPELTASTLTKDGSLEASVTLTNKGTCVGTETLQLYIQDVFGSVVRPVKELKGFRKVTLEPGESRKETFRIDEPMLRFLRADGTVGSELGAFRVWIGSDSRVKEFKEFELV